MRAYLTLDMLSSLAILAILLGISVPNLSSMVSEISLRKEAHKISYSLESLTTKASREASQFTLTLEKNGLYATTHSKPQSTVLVKTLPKRYQLDFLSVNKEIHFYKQGTCSPSSFQLTNGQKKCTFTLSLRCRSSVSCAK